MGLDPPDEEGRNCSHSTVVYTADLAGMAT